MAAVKPDLGYGLTIAFDSSFFVTCTNVSWSGIHREAVETTTMDTTTWRTFMPSDVVDPGELAIEFQFPTDDAPKITGAAEAVTLTWPDAETWIASAFMTDFEVTATGGTGGDNVTSASATLKFTGQITF